MPIPSIDIPISPVAGLLPRKNINPAADEMQDQAFAQVQTEFQRTSYKKKIYRKYDNSLYNI
jgi:hypothetical protein